MKKIYLWGLLLLIACLPVLLGIGSFIYPRYSEFSDLTISHLPNAIFIIDNLRDNGFIPLWADRLMAGYPFSADPLSGLWYPPNWIAILIPGPVGFNLCLLLHLLWGGLGMATFLTRSGLKKTAAIFGGIAFIAMPKLFAHLALGHVSMVYAVVWFPWLLVAEEYRSKSNRSKILSRLLPGIVLGIIALADVRGLAYAGFLYFLFRLWNFAAEIRQNVSRAMIAEGIGGFVVQIAVGAGIAAAQILPLLQFTELSTRANLSADEALVFSLPLKKMINIFIPEFGGYAEWIIYPGALVVFLCILAIATPPLRKRMAFWLSVVALCLLLSFGSNLPFLTWLGSVPGISLLRVPPRLMFVAGMALIVIASHALDALDSGYQRPKFDPIFWMVGISAFFGVLILASTILRIEIGANLIWGASALVVSVVLIGLAERSRLSNNAVAFLFPFVVLIDLVGVNLQSIQYRPASEVFQEGMPVIEALKDDPSGFRVYSPSYALPQLTSARAGIGSVSAINPLQLASFSEYMSAASGAKSDGYSVAIPPLEDANLTGSNIDNRIDAELLGKLNVKYIIASYPIKDERLVETWQSGGIYIYENNLIQPPVWLEEMGVRTNLAPEILEWLPGKIVIRADGPGNLVISEVDYPGWKVTVNEKPAAKLRIANLLMGVSLDAGQKRVEFSYQPTMQYIGLGISIFFWMGILLIALIRVRK